MFRPSVRVLSVPDVPPFCSRCWTLVRKQEFRTMRRRPLALICSLCLAFLFLGVANQTVPAQSKRPIELTDILEWRNIAAMEVSSDGSWMAYRLSPVQGDSEVVIRSTRTDTEHRFPIGEVSGGGMAFSDDSAWVAFTVFPDRKEAARLKKQQKPLRNKVALVKLEDFTKIEFENAKRFAFSGEAASWLAVHAEVPESQARDKDRPKGTDLVLYELATGSRLNLGNVSELAFDKAGRWLAWTVDAWDKNGNGVQLRNLESSTVRVLDSEKAVYERLAWSDTGDALSVLRGVEDKAFEDKLYAAVGFKRIDKGQPTRVVYDPRDDKEFPEGMTLSPNRSVLWTKDRTGILFGIHKLRKKAAEEKAEKKEGAEPAAPAEPEEEEKPDMVVWHWLDKRLQSQQQVEEDRDRRFSYLSAYWPDAGKFVRLADESMREVRTPDVLGRWAVGLDDIDYALSGSMDGRRYQDVYAVNIETGERRLAARRVRWFFGPSPDGSRFLFYDDGHFHAHDMASGQTTNMTRALPVSFVNAVNDHNVVKPPVPPNRLGLGRDDRPAVGLVGHMERPCCGRLGHEPDAHRTQRFRAASQAAGFRPGRERRRSLGANVPGDVRGMDEEARRLSRRIRQARHARPALG
jgi:hypothetical protein